MGEITPEADAPPPDGLVARAARERRPLAARSIAQREEVGTWLAAPVLGRAGTCHGVIAIHDMPFSKLTPVAEATLTELAARLGAALDRPGPTALPRPDGRAVVWLEGPGALPEAS
jgi:hypothetical protein